MFDTLIIQPIFNLLAFIYAILPGHNFGFAIIIFTIVVRFLMWPLVKKQLHQVKLMRKIQPDIKRIEKEAGKDRQKKTMLMMELYKEKGVNPFASLGVLLLQLPILLGLFWGLQRVINDPSQITSFAYSFIQNLEWMKQVAVDLHMFDLTLFGFVDLARPALGAGGLYIPAMILVIASAVAQYFQGAQLMPNDKDARSLRAIFKDAKTGKQPEQSEINAAMSRSMKFLLPAMILLFTIYLPSGLALYWTVSGLVALVQQTIILRRDSVEMQEMAKKDNKPKKISSREKNAKEAEVVTQPVPKQAKTSTTPKKGKASKAKRKKR